MKKTVIAVLAAAFVGLIPNLLLAEGDAAAGQAKSALCGSCHGVDGNSLMAMNPKLAGQSARYMVKQLQEFKSGARESAIMASMVLSLSDQDMEDIAAWYSSQQPTIQGANPESIELAERLYRGGNSEIAVAACSACNAPAGFPLLSGQHAEYTLQQLKNFRSGARQNDGSAMMRTVVERLTDKELEALASYVSGLK
jgi:cytochrome c553